MTTTEALPEVEPPARASAAHDRRTSSGDPYRWHVIGASVILTATLPALVALIVLGAPKPPPPPWSVQAAALGVDPSEISLGETTYLGACALCHGKTGEGIPRLGKPLRNSAFVQGAGDAELLDLLTNGRLPNDPANTSGTLMPARGAQGIDDARLAAVVTYLRAIQDPNAPTVSVEAWNTKPADGASDGQAVAAAGGPGYELFIASCSACHGASGEGMEGLGKPLKASDFVASKSEAELVAFVKTGRPVWDELNTTGLDMPPKGGNPALTDEQIAEIVNYIKSLGASPSSSGAASASAQAGPAVSNATFVASCSACHGASGEGVEGLGKPFKGSEFVRSKSDADLIAFIKTGRPVWDADNTTGVDMPPKGGNPALTDEQIAEIVNFIRTLQQ